MEQALEFTGIFEAETLPALAPGRWYVGLACRACRRHFAIFNEPTNTGGLRISGDARFEATCPNCGRAGSYPVAELVQFQAAQGGSISTA
ncbi:hypothetical protein [Methylocystis parvus]|uniref:Uncharacterized protein n=1 Tax=Methylocystis parvus TaxID=134 RepID=A0A6B8M343_9HYPH|nr:hypothetical protein [Methylocystis parvus]QGM97341.1 hypothetical protein F7D14_07540 [Methylocystis parvus]WBJ98748.1 hypothetical protein MMG94_12075 [Methylocystis parvus OBBP]